MTENEDAKIETKGAVNTFLNELKNIFQSGNYIFDLPNREDKTEQYTNIYCKSVLNYDNLDVIEELKLLTFKNYSRTLIAKEDKKNVYYYEFR